VALPAVSASSENPSLRAQLLSALAVACFVAALWGFISWRSAPPPPPPLPSGLP
jgi:hypothetical protein